jgi:non-ribosomal peptide synthetase component F
MPFDLLVEKLNPERSGNRGPLFQVVFQLLAGRRAAAGADDLAAEHLVLESRAANFDLSVLLLESEDGIAGSIDYSVDLFDDSAVRLLLSHFRELLASVARDPDASLLDLPMDREEEPAEAPAPPVRRELEQFTF